MEKWKLMIIAASTSAGIALGGFLLVFFANYSSSAVKTNAFFMITGIAILIAVVLLGPSKD